MIKRYHKNLLPPRNGSFDGLISWIGRPALPEPPDSSGLATTVGTSGVKDPFDVYRIDREQGGNPGDLANLPSDNFKDCFFCAAIVVRN